MRLVILSTCTMIFILVEGTMLGGEEGIQLFFLHFVGDMNAIVQIKVITVMEKVALILVELWITTLERKAIRMHVVKIGMIIFHGNGAVAQDMISCGTTTECMMCMMNFVLHHITITHVITTTVTIGVNTTKANVRMF
jgi:hypothetical protein